METIEPKERERIEKSYYESGMLKDTFVESVVWAKGGQYEHLHLQNTVIEPLAKSGAGYKMLYDASLEQILIDKSTISKLEAENKELRDGMCGLCQDRLLTKNEEKNLNLNDHI